MLQSQMLAFASSLITLQGQASVPLQLDLLTPKLVNENSHSRILIAQSNYQAALVSLINQQRQKMGLKPLRFSAKLSQAAQIHAQDLVKNNLFDHTGSNGSQPWDRVGAVGYSYSTIAENIAAGSKTPSQVFQQWMNSPGHRANMLNPNVSEVGVGFILNAPRTSYGNYWVLVLARPSR
jgi:uncharacterized protein YkwD